MKKDAIKIRIANNILYQLVSGSGSGSGSGIGVGVGIGIVGSGVAVGVGVGGISVNPPISTLWKIGSGVQCGYWLSFPIKMYRISIFGISQ